MTRQICRRFSAGIIEGAAIRFAILGRRAAEAYCWWPMMDRLLEEGCRFHPETLTKFALLRAQCKIVHSPVMTVTLKRDEQRKVITREPEILPEETMCVLQAR